MSKIFVIAGHGAGDPGACGNGFSEAERVRVLARKIKELGGGNVILGDLSRDYYRDNGVSTVNLPKEYEIIELHMDAGQESARGGHVIIYSGFEADDYDKALADMLADILPGRSQMIVGRNNLANPERAAMRGYGYRLVEFGFITNAEDVKVFNTRMDDIAAGVLAAFGIGKIKNTSSTEETEMKEIWAIEGQPGQYYFDGSHLHGFHSQREKDLLVVAHKRITGKDINVHLYSKKDFNDLRSLIKNVE